MRWIVGPFHNPAKGRLSADFLHGEVVEVKEPHAALDALIIRGCAFHRWVRSGIGRLTTVGKEGL
jgi:hypothetical protein